MLFQQQELSTINKCPVCLHGRNFNILSKDGFLCTHCLNEFKLKGKKLYLLEINENGDINPIVLIEF
jgi:hypothetical protein